MFNVPKQPGLKDIGRATLTQIVMPDLPAEIILDILECMWSKKDLGTMRLLSKSFAALARPALFGSCSFRIPYSPSGERRYMPRLEFFASDDIAQYVHTISVYPEPGQIRDAISTPWSNAADMNVALDQFFERLPFFKNIKTLQCTDISFNDFAISQLVVIKNFGKLDIRDCTITGSVKQSDDRIKVSNMDFLSTSRDASKAGPYARWLRVVTIDSLQDFNLSFANADIAFEFLFVLRTIPSVPLTHLIMPHDPRKVIPAPSGSQNYATTILTMQLGYIDNNTLDDITNRFPLVQNLTLLIGSEKTYNIQVSHI